MSGNDKMNDFLKKANFSSCINKDHPNKDSLTRLK